MRAGCLHINKAANLFLNIWRLVATSDVMINFAPMKKTIPFLLFFLMATALYSQGGDWDTYIARHEKGPGSTLVNMGLKKSAPDSSRPWLFAAGVKFKNCTNEGLPAPDAFLSLNQLSDSVVTLMEKISHPVLAGTFSYQCERKDYFYVADTTGLQAAIEEMLHERFPAYAPVFIVKKDPKWDAYLHFLYPNDETAEYMRNQKTVMRLMKAGDINSISRPVDHFLRFKTEKDREGFIFTAIGKKYTIVSKGTDSLTVYPFTLRILRNDPVSLSAINKITLDLKKDATRFNGLYETWETVIMRR